MREGRREGGSQVGPEIPYPQPPAPPRCLFSRPPHAGLRAAARRGRGRPGRPLPLWRAQSSPLSSPRTEAQFRSVLQAPLCLSLPLSSSPLFFLAAPPTPQFLWRVSLVAPLEPQSPSLPPHFWSAGKQIPRVVK